MKRLRELLEQLNLHFQVEIAICDILDEKEKRIVKLEQENLKLKTKIDSLEKRYSEILMLYRETNKKLPKT